MTYTSRYQLEKRARSGQGRDRLQHLQSLVTEFQDTKRKEFKHQVLANLANFAYDPVNYEYFRQLNVLDLFLGETIIIITYDDQSFDVVIITRCDS
jgi:hypothetical protein